MIAWVLVLVGALNWGLVGAGMLFGDVNLNLVDLIFGKWMVVEAIVYLLVGVSAFVCIFGCKCKKCKEGCDTCEAKDDTHSGSDMNSSMGSSETGSSDNQ